MTKLAARRLAAGLSQKDLSDLTGVSKRSIQAYEQGWRDINKAIPLIINALCQALKCKPEDLLGDTDSV